MIAFHPLSLLSIQTRLPHPNIAYHSPLEIAAGAGGIWIADYVQRRVVRVDPNTGEVVTAIRVGGHPWQPAAAGDRVYVTVD